MTKTILVDGVELFVQKCRRGWEAWYNDNHSVTYEAKTRREVINDALGDRNWEVVDYFGVMFTK